MASLSECWGFVSGLVDQSGESVKESSAISELSIRKARSCESWLCFPSPSLIPASLRRDITTETVYYYTVFPSMFNYSIIPP